MAVAELMIFATMARVRENFMLIGGSSIFVGKRVNLDVNVGRCDSWGRV